MRTPGPLMHKGLLGAWISDALDPKGWAWEPNLDPKRFRIP